MKEDKIFQDPLEDDALPPARRFKLGRGKLFKRDADAPDLKISDLSPGFFQRKPALELQTVPAVLGSALPAGEARALFGTPEDMHNTSDMESNSGQLFKRVEDYEDDEPTIEQLEAEARPGAPTHGFRGELIIDHSDGAEESTTDVELGDAEASLDDVAGKERASTDGSLDYEDLDSAMDRAFKDDESVQEAEDDAEKRYQEQIARAEQAVQEARATLDAIETSSAVPSAATSPSYLNLTETPRTSRYVNQILKDVRTQKNKPLGPVEQIEDFNPTPVYTGDVADVAETRQITGLEKTAPNIRAEALQALDRLASEKMEKTDQQESDASVAPALPEMPLERLYERSHEVKDLDSTTTASTVAAQADDGGATPVATILSQSPLYAKATTATPTPQPPQPLYTPPQPIYTAPVASPAPAPVPMPVPAAPATGQFIPVGPDGRPMVSREDYRQAIARGFWGAMIILAVLAVWYVARG